MKSLHRISVLAVYLIICMCVPKKPKYTLRDNNSIQINTVYKYNAFAPLGIDVCALAKLRECKENLGILRLQISHSKIQTTLF